MSKVPVGFSQEAKLPSSRKPWEQPHRSALDYHTAEAARRISDIWHFILECTLLGVCVVFTVLCAQIGGLEGVGAGVLTWGYCMWHIRWWRRLR